MICPCLDHIQYHSHPTTIVHIFIRNILDSPRQLTIKSRTHRKRHLRRNNRPDPADHGAEAEQRVPGVSGEQLRRVHVDAAERLRDGHLAQQVQAGG